MEYTWFSLVSGTSRRRRTLKIPRSSGGYTRYSIADELYVRKYVGFLESRCITVPGYSHVTNEQKSARVRSRVRARSLVGSYGGAIDRHRSFGTLSRRAIDGFSSDFLFRFNFPRAKPTTEDVHLRLLHAP